MAVADRIIGSFPAALAGDAKSLALLMSVQGATLSPNDFSVNVGAETISIPERLYCAELFSWFGPRGLTSCLLTRHHNGFVRQRALDQVLRLDEPWAMPFIIRLVGEYVVEIVEFIDKAFEGISSDYIRDFVLANPSFIELTRARMISYWNCYYRHKPRYEYVGFRLMDRIEATRTSQRV